MNRSLYPYYEQELRFLRKDLEGFAKSYPAAAGRLLLDASQSADPHVERLIEAVALLTARVQKKIDDEFPELTDSLLGVLSPHYLAPIPSMTVVGFDVDGSAANLQGGFVLPRGRRLRTRTPGEPCIFRTCYAVTLWPIRIVSATLSPPPLPVSVTAPPGTAAAIHLRLASLGDATFSSMSLDRLRLYLQGEPHLVAPLYESIFHRSIEVAFVSPDAKAKQPPINVSPEECLHQVGFEPEENLLAYPRQTHAAHRLLTEFFAFPQKFNFVDLGGFDRVRKAGFGREVDVVIFLKEYPSAIARAVDARTFRLGCTPVVNLFEKTAEPVVVDESTHEYRVTADAGAPRGFEVISIDSVVAADVKTGSVRQCAPFYSFRHEHGPSAPDSFWFATRRPSALEGDRGSDVFLSLVDLNFQPRRRGDVVLTLTTTCSNRDVPAMLQRAGEQLRFELDFTAPVIQATSLRTVTAAIRPSLGRRAFWRLVSQLSLNHLSLTGEDGREAIKEILRLHDLSGEDSNGATSVSPIVEGLVGLSSRRTVAQIGSPAASGFARGIEVVVELDEEKYVGVGVFLFASVLDRFFGLFASLNSFVQLSVKTKIQDGYFRRWAPRAGDKPIL